MALRAWYRRWRRRNVPTPPTTEHALAPGAGAASTFPTEALIANPTDYGYVGNGRMAIPVEDWLKLVEAFGPDNVALHGPDGNSVDTGGQVAAIIDEQIIEPILRGTGTGNSR